MPESTPLHYLVEPCDRYSKDITFHCSEYSFLMMRKCYVKLILQRWLCWVVYFEQGSRRILEHCKELKETILWMVITNLPCPVVIPQTPKASLPVGTGSSLSTPGWLAAFLICGNSTRYAPTRWAECNWLGLCLGLLSQLTVGGFFPCFATDLMRALSASYGSRYVYNCVPGES